MPPQSVFISYSHNNSDRPLLDQLLKQMAPLIQTGRITVWEDAQIQPGDNWEHEIRTHLDNADIVMLLVSSDYLASNYVNNIEIPTAMRREQEGKCKIIPVLLRSCLYDLMPYAQYEFLPKTAHNQRLVPLDQWDSKDEAFTVVLRRLHQLLTHSPAPVSAPTHAPATPTASPARLSELELKGLHAQLELATSKKQRLQTALIIETDVPRQFALEHEIARLDETLQSIKTQLEP